MKKAISTEINTYTYRNTYRMEDKTKYNYTDNKKYIKK